MVPTAPGSIIHSNDFPADAIIAEYIQCLGMTLQQAQQTADITLRKMQAKALTVPGQQQPDAAATTAAGNVLLQQHQQRLDLQQQQPQQQQQEQFHAAQDAAFAAGALQQQQAAQAQRAEEQMEEDLLTDDTGDEAEAAKANVKVGDIDVVKKIKKS